MGKPSRELLEVAAVCFVALIIMLFVSSYLKVKVNPDNFEEVAIDRWINDESLNIYGDAPQTVYTGGTPLYNSATGQRQTRYEYIFEKHPDKPWNK